MKSKINKEEIKKILVENSAYLSISEGELLFNLAEKCQGDIVEIGSFLGGSTVTLAKGLKYPHKVYAVDPHIWIDALVRKGKKLVTVARGAKHFLESNIKKWGMEKRIVLIEKTSEKAAKKWRGKVDLLWIDGDHEYKSAKKDFLLWEPFLKKDGVIAFHDSVYNEEVKKKIIPFALVHHLPFEGPQRVVKEYLHNSKRFGKIKSVDTITYAVKLKNANPIEKLKNKVEVYKINNPEGPSFLKKATKHAENLFLKLFNFFKSIPSKIDRVLGLLELFFNRLFNLLKSIPSKIDRGLGLLGLFLKKNSPKTYYFLKKIKNLFGLK